MSGYLHNRAGNQFDALGGGLPVDAINHHGLLGDVQQQGWVA